MVTQKGAAMKHVRQVFDGAVVDLDGNEFVDCQFVNCTLAFAGNSYSLVRCGIDGTFSLRLAGHAANTLMLLQMLSSTQGGKDYIIGMLDARNVELGTGSAA